MHSVKCIVFSNIPTSGDLDMTTYSVQAPRQQSSLQHSLPPEQSASLTHHTSGTGALRSQS